MPSASRVAGLYAWNQLGRKVIKGQKGIRILAPMIGVRRKKDPRDLLKLYLYGYLNPDSVSLRWRTESNAAATWGCWLIRKALPPRPQVNRRV